MEISSPVLLGKGKDEEDAQRNHKECSKLQQVLSLS